MTQPILLVTMTPPGGGNVGEIILRDFCRELPRGSITICRVAKSASPKAGSDCELHSIQAPEDHRTPALNGRVGGALYAMSTMVRFAPRARRVAQVIAGLASSCRAAKVWVTLDSPFLIAVAGYLAESLPVPLLSLVWDPPEYMAWQRKWDCISRTWLMNRFGCAMRKSARVAVVSEAMESEYGQRYGARCVVLRHALEKEPVLRTLESGPLYLGFAGTLYDTAQLDLLCQVLHRDRWILEGRPVTLRMIGNDYRFRSLTGPGHVELMGWRDSEETQRLLSECHLLYLPQSFGEGWKDSVRLTFPTKFSAYVGTGRPVLVHAPAESGVARFCISNECGIVCDQMDTDALGTVIHSALVSARYEQLSAGAGRAYHQYLCPGVMREQLASFVGIDLSGGAGMTGNDNE